MAPVSMNAGPVTTTSTASPDVDEVEFNDAAEVEAAPESVAAPAQPQVAEDGFDWANSIRRAPMHAFSAAGMTLLPSAAEEAASKAARKSLVASVVTPDDVGRAGEGPVSRIAQLGDSGSRLGRAVNVGFKVFPVVTATVDTVFAGRDLFDENASGGKKVASVATAALASSAAVATFLPGPARIIGAGLMGAAALTGIVSDGID